MQALPTPDEVWSLIPTADPGEAVYRAAFSKDVFIPRQLRLGMTLREAPTWIEKNRVSDFGSYVLTATEPAIPGWTYAYFAMPRTEAERNTPVETYWDTGVETWPEVYEGLYIVANENDLITLEGENGVEKKPRRLVFYVKTPQTTAECLVKVEVFQSETRFKGLTSAKPMPGHVSFDFGGLGNGGFTALHPLIKIPRGDGDGKYKVLVDAAPGFVDAPLTVDQVFPATEFEDWEPYVWRNSIKRQNGLWIKERVTIYPPDKPDPSFT